MKIVFKIIFSGPLPPPSWPARRVRRAPIRSTTRRAICRRLLPRSQNVTYKKVQIEAPSWQRLTLRLGYAPAKSSYTFYVATSGGHTDGYAFIDEEKGEHLPITFAVKLSPTGKVVRQEVVVYREARGDEVRDERFRSQFVGKGASDAIDTGSDIPSSPGRQSRRAPWPSASSARWCCSTS